MAKRPTTSSVPQTLTNTVTVNNNFDAVKAAFDNTLSRDGSTPNQMNADIDLNSNDLLNVGTVNADNVVVDGVDFSVTIDNIEESLAEIEAAVERAEAYANATVGYAEKWFIGGNNDAVTLPIPAELVDVDAGGVGPVDPANYTLSEDGLTVTPTAGYYWPTGPAGVTNCRVKLYSATTTETLQPMLDDIDAAQAAAEAAAASIQPYASRAEAVAASKVPGQLRFEVIDPDGLTLRYVEDAATSTPALTMADGTKLVPDGDVTPQHFGALGDGVTDDTTALQAAIDFCEATGTTSGFGGKILSIPPGRYLHGTLTIRRPISIVGAGRRRVEFKTIAGTTGRGLHIEPIYDSLDYPSLGHPAANIQISGILFAGPGKTDIGAANGIELTRASSNSVSTEVILRDVATWNFPGHGLRGLSFDGLVRAFDLTSYNNGQSGISTTSCYDWRFFGGEVGANGVDGITFSGSIQMRIFGVYCYANSVYGLNSFNSMWSWTGGAIDTNGEHGLNYDNRLSGYWSKMVDVSFRYNSGATANTFHDIRVGSLANNELLLIGCDFNEPNSGFCLKNIYFDTTSNTVRCIGPSFETGTGISDPDFSNQINQVLLGDVGDFHTRGTLLRANKPVEVFTPSQYTGMTLKAPDGTLFAKIMGLNASNKGGVFTLYDTSAAASVELSYFGSGVVTKLPINGGPYADDTAAAAGGVPVGGIYRKAGGVIVWRVS